jgi:hypothetical protein
LDAVFKVCQHFCVQWTCLPEDDIASLRQSAYILLLFWKAGIGFHHPYRLIFINLFKQTTQCIAYLLSGLGKNLRLQRRA